MNLWHWIKRKMWAHGDAIAFSEGKITYRQLIEEAEAGPVDRARRGRLTAVEGETRQAQALALLRALARGQVAVPLSDCYGEEDNAVLRARIEADERIYRGTAVLMFTSGTTAGKKGVLLTHRNLVKNLRAIEGYFARAEGRRLTIARPLVHIAVLTGELLYGLCRGMEISFFEEPFSARRLCAALAEQKTELLCMTPTMAYHLSRCKQELDLKTVVLSGERLSARLAEQLAARYPGTAFYNVYGLTENSPRAAALCPEQFLLRPGSIGKPVAHTRFRIADGELLVKSPSVMKGYYDDPALTAQKIRRGWLHTGDLARRDGEGFYYILGRRDRMIIRAGRNLCPEEIEARVRQIAGVEDCRVRGEDDPAFGQRIVLTVAGTVDSAELLKELRHRLPAGMMPNRVELTDHIGLTASGKVSRP